jgi:acyl-CoA synthetase (AMP-forming)/AMP-acid ligase II
MLRHTLVEQLRFNAEAFGQRPALQVVGGPELTYRDALERTIALAAAIRERSDGSAVAVLRRNGPDSALAFLACQLAGVAALPVNPMLAPPEIEYLLNDSSAGLLVHSADCADLVASLPGENRPVTLCTDDVDNQSVSWDSFTPSDPSDPFVIGYTSGTTGFPKGAVYDGDSMYIQYLRWAVHFELNENSRLLIAGPMFHNSYGGLSVLSLMLGATSRILTSFDADTACAELGQHCTFAFLVPSMLTQILRAWRAGGRPPLNSLRRLLSSGAAVNPVDLEAAFEAFPQAVVSEAYGWSEGGWVTHETKQRGAVVSHCVGHPMVGAEVALFGDDGHRCGPAETGEIGVRNITPFKGYLNPNARAETSADGRFLLSGDIGRFLPDGRLLVVDRKKDIIVTGGENVASGEVERVLLAYPQVLDAAVVGRPDERWGEAVTAVIVWQPGSDGDDRVLREHCAQNLARYKIPKHFEFVDSLPRNSMGKVQKFLLRDPKTAEAAPTGPGGA